ncbi:cytochrome b5-like [Anopheles nili]|uniref:cytochrome b5-like n=1 Tax=Anopheles nili TaxID=185578 RepID=UPI00237AF090|nr:cytochrome b5-like [Anopheles nili]
MTGNLIEYTLPEVALHNGKEGNSSWVVIRDVVYDVTKYLEDHPGGSDLIAEFAGKDGTKEFEDFGHSSDAIRTLKTLQIGVLVASDQAKNRSGSTRKQDEAYLSQEDALKRKRSKRRMFILCG